MGKHQVELAIAFFLLAGDASSAVTVCVKNLGDEQLALVICRLIEGRGGPLEHQLITKFIVPSAIHRGDYWLASLLEVCRKQTLEFSQDILIAAHLTYFCFR